LRSPVGGLIWGPGLAWLAFGFFLCQFQVQAEEEGEGVFFFGHAVGGADGGVEGGVSVAQAVGAGGSRLR
jgi:hypothetical protein